MATFDLSLDELKVYKPPRVEELDFDQFWHNTLSESNQYPLDPHFELVDYGLQAQVTYDVTFTGFGGQPVKAWLLLPDFRPNPVPCVVEYIGYGGGRGFPFDWLLWSSVGYAHLIMDTRGQGSGSQKGDTPDLYAGGGNPSVPGFMTQGILNHHDYYYRRVFIDAIRAVDAARSHASINPDHIAVTGGSQGGGITLAVAGLVSDLDAAMPDVPFLCHYRRATELVDTYPYKEIGQFCHTHRDKIDQVFRTLSYFDGVNFAARAHAPTLFSVGLMDEVCPPSTVYAAYNHYNGPKDIRIYHYNEHEGGGNYQTLEKIKYIKKIWN